MLPDTSNCVADHNDELSKDSVIDYVRESDEESVPISCNRARAKGVRKCKHVSGTEKLPEFLYIATCNVCPWRCQNPLRINGNPITGKSFIVFAGKRNVSLDKAKKTPFLWKVWIHSDV